MNPDREVDFADALQLGCNFLTTWKRGREGAIEMHCEMAQLDDMHLWRIIGGLASYAIIVETAVLVLRGASSEDNLQLAEYEPRAAAMVRALLAYLLRGPVGGHP
jgi:hypothetical protein